MLLENTFIRPTKRRCKFDGIIFVTTLVRVFLSDLDNLSRNIFCTQLCWTSTLVQRDFNTGATTLDDWSAANICPTLCDYEFVWNRHLRRKISAGTCNISTVLVHEGMNLHFERDIMLLSPSLQVIFSTTILPHKKKESLLIINSSILPYHTLP